MNTLSLKDNMGFYNMTFIIQGIDPDFYKNTLDIHHKNFKEKIDPELGLIRIGELYQIYKKKYNIFVEGDSITKKLVFNKKFKVPVHSLSIVSSNLERVKSLPKDLLALYIQGSSSFINFPVSIIPKNIVSIIFKWSAFPFNGADLGKFKNLKVIGATDYSMVKFPKLPKNMEYISFINSGLAFNFPSSLNGFKLSEYPKLKYFDLSGSGIKRKDIPQEWKDAKKSKKIYIKY